MTKLYRRLGTLTVLGVTAGVSMLAGSVLLGSASADEPPSKPNVTLTKAANQPFSVAVRVDKNINDLEPTCVISYRAWSGEDGELPELGLTQAVPGIKMSAFEPGDLDEAIASGKIKVFEPGEKGDFTIAAGEGGFTTAKRIEHREGEEPKIFEFKAGELPEGGVAGTVFSMKPGELPEGVEPIDSANCTVIGEDGEITPPHGVGVKPAAASITLP